MCFGNLITITLRQKWRLKLFLNMYPNYLCCKGNYFWPFPSPVLTLGRDLQPPFENCRVWEEPSMETRQKGMNYESPVQFTWWKKNLQGLERWTRLPRFCRTFGVLQNLCSTGFLLYETFFTTFLLNPKGAAEFWGTFGSPGPSFEDRLFFLPHGPMAVKSLWKFWSKRASVHRVLFSACMSETARI